MGAMINSSGELLTMEEYIFELPDKQDKSCKLNYFFASLEFVREVEEFKTSDLQRYLKCGYGTVCKVLDALCVLCAIEKIGEPPNLKYGSLIKK